MPLTPKGRKIMTAMHEQYGEEKGERVFYASRNAGTITGVERHGKTALSSGRHARRTR